MKKIVKIVGIILLIILSNFAILANTVQAVENNRVNLYAKGSLNRILKYNGILIKTTHVVYSESGKEYPAYCLNVELPGVEEIQYEVTEQGKITDLGLWRVVTNGYPYKSLEQLGVANEEEAYIATKQSIYCYLYKRGTEKYSPVGDAGERTLNAMNRILTNAQNSADTFEQTKIEINTNEKWEVDEKDKKYVSREYEIKSKINISQYKVEIKNQPEGTKITDLENNEKIEFNSSEKFKILIPIKSLQKSGEFQIKIKTTMETKPVLYGKAPNENVQNYALTTYSYEDINSEIIQNYNKNETKIIIEKEDEETKEKLSGAIFEILDNNKNVIKTLITNEDGIIEIKQILPGTYFIKEIKSPNGYNQNEKLYQIDVKLNEKITVKIENSKIKIEETKEESVKKVEEIRKLPVTGM